MPKRKRPAKGPCATCEGTGEMRCPACSGSGRGGEESEPTCPYCEGTGRVRCNACNGTGRASSATPAARASSVSGRQTVKLPWGTARIVEVVSVAQPNHSPCIELLQFPDGKLALRFSAYYKGKPVQGPLVLDQDSIQHVAQTAASSRIIKPLLAYLGGGPKPVVKPDWIILLPIPIEDDLTRAPSGNPKPTGGGSKPDVKPDTIVLVPLPIEDLGRPASGKAKPTDRPSRKKKPS